MGMKMVMDNSCAFLSPFKTETKAVMRKGDKKEAS